MMRDEVRGCRCMFGLRDVGGIFRRGRIARLCVGDLMLWSWWTPRDEEGLGRMVDIARLKNMAC